MEKYSILMLMSVYHAVSGHTRVVDALSIELEKMGHNVTLGSFNFKKDPPEQISKLERQARELKKIRNIIHNHQTLMNYHLLFVKNPIIFHYHGASSKLQKINLKIASVICNNKIDRIISISESAKKEIKEYFPRKSNTVVYNGVNTNFYKEILRKENQKIKLLFVGNLFKYKNIQFLIKNFVELKNEFPNINLQIIGDGEYKENIIELINELNLNENIQLLGRVSDEELRKYYSSCDIYFTASKWEFFNLPLLSTNNALALPFERSYPKATVVVFELPSPISLVLFISLIVELL